MNEFSTYEFVVPQKIEGGWKLARIALIISYVLFTAGAAVLIAVVLNLPWLVAPLPIFTWILVFVTWRYVSVEYECSIICHISAVTPFLISSCV